jgi:hypothetical protein
MGIRRDIDDLAESDVTLDNKMSTDPQVKKLWGKCELIFRNLCKFNRPLVEIGKQCMNYARGDIFDEATKNVYEKIQNKICIEPKVLKTRINTAVGMLLQARRKGKVTSESAKDANEIYAANAILKFIEKEAKEQFLITKMLFNGCLTGYPNVLIFDRSVTAYGDPLGGMSVEVLPWDTVVFNKINDTDGSDLTDLIWITRKSQSELIDENPDREDDIKRHFEKISNEYGESADSIAGLTVEDARFLDYDVMTGLSNYRVDGRLLCVNRLCIQKVKTKVAILESDDDETMDFQILPPQWSKIRKEEWAAAHPEYRMIEKETKLLWHCRWTSCGLMLVNEPSFFQETDPKGNPIFPVAMFVPQIIDGVPTGPGPDDRQLTLMKAIAETEFLHDVRTGSGDVLAYKQGSVINSDDIPTELSIGNGILQIDPEEVPGPIEESVKFLKRTPNTVYGEYSTRVDSMLIQNDGISPSVMGQVTGERYSGASKQADMAAVGIGYSIVAENMNKTIERIKNIECAMIPYCFTEEQVMQLYDDEVSQEVALTVNETEYDENGDPKIVANDLTSVKWRWRLTEGDDSPTAKQAELNEMLIFWNTTAPVLIEADESLMTLASVLMSMSNRTAKQIGSIIAKKAQVNAQAMSQQKMMETMATVQEKQAKGEAAMVKAKRSGFSFSITPDDLNQIPGLYKILTDTGYINPNAMQQPPVDAMQSPTPGGV